jgi:hypothetical protein
MEPQRTRMAGNLNLVQAIRQFTDPLQAARAAGLA